MFTIHKISFFLPRRSFQSVFIKWKNKWQTEYSVEKNLLHHSSQMFVQQLCVFQNTYYFYSLPASKYTIKGAGHILSPTEVYELESCIPLSSKVVKKKMKPNKPRIFFLLFCYYYFWLSMEWWSLHGQGLVCERELCYGAGASCPYKELTSQDAESLLCLMKADFH